MIKTSSELLTDRLSAAKKAHDLVSQKLWILDTETTGLLNSDQVIEIGIVDEAGNCVLDERIKPTVPISSGASAIHGITYDDVSEGLSFRSIHNFLRQKDPSIKVLIYNSAFDSRLIDQSSVAHNLPLIDLNATCVMLLYSQYIGDWDSSHSSYKWQKLPGGDHSAIGDCVASWGILRTMARYYEIQQGFEQFSA